MSELVVAQRLGKSFTTRSGQLDVLTDIDLTINAGERVAIVGPSGAGKTTLMHLLGVLERPSSGNLCIDGEDVSNLKGKRLDAFRNRMVGFVFQFHQLLPEFTALENVMMPLFIAGVKRSEAQERAAAFLEDVGLAHRIGHKPGELSGGEQQRVAVARSLINEPRLLLADEPTGSLDSATTDEIYDLIDGLHRSKGLTIILVTHNRELANRMDRLITIEDGRLVQA